MAANTLITVELDQAKLREVQQMLREIPREMPKILCRSLNDAAVHARSQAVKELATELTVRQKDIRDSLRVRKATYTDLSAAVTIGDQRIGLIGYAARQGARGVSYQIHKGVSRDALRSTFFATMASGHRAVFKRVGEYRVGPRSSGKYWSKWRRQKIMELRGPSLGVVSEDAPAIIERVQEESLAYAEKRLDAQVALILGRRSKGSAA